MSTLNELNQTISNANADKRLVFGCGDGRASIVFIGEAPGKNEVEKGQAFVGKAGANLDGFLQKLGLQRSNIYITNAVKFRPTKAGKKGEVNRKPTSDEIQQYREYLMSELAIIKPRLIVTLGAVPLSSLYNIKSLIMSENAGRLTKIGDYNVFPLYHPASVIYNRSLQVEYDGHLQMLNQIITDDNF